jgi:RND family efflux transporter MFP subunit
VNRNRKPRGVFRILSFVGGGLCLVILMLYMAGFFAADKIGPGEVNRPYQESLPPKRTARASVQTMTEFYEAVGTVRPRTETSIEAQVTGRILEILVRPGDGVRKGEPLIVLDSRESQARVGQARQGLSSSKARLDQARRAVMAAQAVQTQAESEFRRVKTYFDSEAATARDLERAESAYLQAKAGLQRAKSALAEAKAGVKQANKVVEVSRIALGYNRILSPEDGQVVKRLVEPGDLAWPGKTLMVLQTRGELRLEAFVREGLIHRVSPGVTLKVVVTALDKTFEGVVEEVVPSADPLTRTFLVKVGLRGTEGLFPGMFGRLMVPIEEKRVVVVPESAVTRIGQLEVVRVKTQAGWQRIFVKTGKKLGDHRVEVLSGLRGDEILALEGETDA